MTDSKLKAGTHTIAEIRSEPEIWQSCISALDETHEIGELASLLKRGGEWLFVGCGSSYYLALTASATWSQLTGETTRAVPASEILLFPELLPESCNAILISRSGRTSEIIEAGRYLEKRGMKSPLAITCGTETPIERVAARTVRLPQADEKSTVMTRSFTSMLLALQMLAAERGKADEFAKGLRALSAETQPRMSDIESTIHRLTESQTFEDYVFLGQGPFHGIAQEAMLKVKEMSCSYAQCFHTLEFRHGPKAIVNPRTLVTFFLSESGFESELSVIREIKDLGAITLVVANEADSVVRASADYLIELSLSVPEAARAAAFVIPGQLLGFHTGVAKGFDPDNPRNLSRVVTLQNGKDGAFSRGTP